VAPFGPAGPWGPGVPTFQEALPAASEVNTSPSPAPVGNNNPLADTLPLTPSKLPGVAVPMPTNPFGTMRSASKLCVLSTKGCASVVPRKFLAGLLPALPLVSQSGAVWAMADGLSATSDADSPRTPRYCRAFASNPDGLGFRLGLAMAAPRNFLLNCLLALEHCQPILSHSTHEAVTCS
jgi:hypothetical protein